MTTAEAKAERKKKKKVSTALAMESPVPSPVIMICGKRVIFSGQLTLFASMAFVTGYLDVVSINRYGIYVTMITGNLVGSAVSIGLDNDSTKGILGYVASIFTGYFGGLLSCYIIEMTQDKKKAFTWLTLFSAIAIVLVDVSDYLGYSGNQFIEVLLAVASGALLHWVVKFGFTTALMTMNALKLAEASFRLAYGISQGGAKLRGDVLVMISLLGAFIGGTWASIGMNALLNNWTNLPLLAIHIYQLFLLHGAISWYDHEIPFSTRFSKACEGIYGSFILPKDPYNKDNSNNNNNKQRSTSILGRLKLPHKLKPNNKTNNKTTNISIDAADDFHMSFAELTPHERETFVAQRQASRQQKQAEEETEDDEAILRGLASIEEGNGHGDEHEEEEEEEEEEGSVSTADQVHNPMTSSSSSSSGIVMELAAVPAVTVPVVTDTDTVSISH